MRIAGAGPLYTQAHRVVAPAAFAGLRALAVGGGALLAGDPVLLGLSTAG